MSGRWRKRYWLYGLGVLAVIALGGYLMVVRPLMKQVNLTALASPAGVTGVEVPPGFEVNLFASGLNGPRFMHFGPDGALYIADRGNDRVVALRDADGDGTADRQRVFAENLDSPHSVVFHQGAWYVGIPSGVIRLEDTDDDGIADQRQTVINDYPTDGHNTRTVAFLPDGRMVVSVGSSCNVCIEDDPRRAAVVVYDGGSGSGEKVFASGLRNAVGLAIHPDTGELWATNNGRDLMGDNLPPEAVYIVREGADYGWPFCHNGAIVDPDFGKPNSCQDVVGPVINMQAHSAPLGMIFYTAQTFPEKYHGDLFIAFHGSWNRSIPTGYKVVRLALENSRPLGPVEEFATGWLDHDTGEVSGRPVGLAIGPDGALYVSDDKAGMIYRVQYTGP